MEGRPAEPGNEDGPEERSVEEGAGEDRQGEGVFGRILCCCPCWA